MKQEQTEKKSIDENDKCRDRKEKFDMYSDNLIRETEKEMKEILNQKQIDYIKNCQMQEKILL